MFIRLFALFVLAFGLFVTQTRATTSTCLGVFLDESGVPSCPITFTPGNNGVTTGVFDFTSSGDGKLIVSFVKVLTTFTLTVTVNHHFDSFTNFPGAEPVQYANGNIDQYDFTGSLNNPNDNGMPVKNVDYKGLITLTLSYFTSQQANTPLFLHAPGDNATAVYTEDILTSYSSFPVTTVCTDCGAPTTPGDPTMSGTTPGISSVAAFDKLGAGDSFCLVSPKPPATFPVGQEIEISFRLTPPSTSCSANTGNSIKDKDARLSVVDSQGNLQAIRKGDDNKFHFDKDDGVNERDLDTEGLLPGTYTVTIFSDEFSPYSFTITLTPCTTDCN